MNAPSPYNANPELSGMKEDIASRSFNLKVKQAVITLGMAAAGVLGGLMIASMLPALASMTMIAAAAGGIAGIAAGGALSDVVTLKERTKLKIDEEMTQSYMQGKNYWGEGFREEVAEYGYAGPQIARPKVPQRDSQHGR